VFDLFDCFCLYFILGLFFFSFAGAWFLNVSHVDAVGTFVLGPTLFCSVVWMVQDGWLLRPSRG
jgi:hypothetical protein